MNSNNVSEKATNCWEFMEKQGDEEKCQSCIVKTTTAASGYLHGVNGGRACMFIRNTNCSEEEWMSIPEKISNVCSSCDFYRQLKNKNNANLNYFEFRMHLKKQS